MADVRADKAALRRRLAERRRALRPADLVAAALGLRDVLLETPEVAAAGRVAAYVSVGTEPGTGPLVEVLSERGVTVLLPVVQPDRDLDWAPYEGPGSLRAAPRGLLEPTGEPLGLDAVLDADVVLLPGLAADRRGGRLGRGGGSYDRVLRRLRTARAAAWTCVLLHDGELLDLSVPREPHDQAVDAVATPGGVQRVRAPG